MACRLFRHPPVQFKSAPRRDVLPNLPNRPHGQAHFLHRLPRHRRFLALTGLHFAAHRRPMPSAPNVRRPLNEQNLFPIRNHGDDSVEHEFDGFVSASGLLELLVASDTIAACRDRQQEIRKFGSDAFLTASLTHLRVAVPSPSGRGKGEGKMIQTAPTTRFLTTEARRAGQSSEGEEFFIPSPLGKTLLAGCSKRSRGEAREKSTSGGVHRQYVDARRLSATKHMRLFQQSATARKAHADYRRESYRSPEPVISPRF